MKLKNPRNKKNSVQLKQQNILGRFSATLINQWMENKKKLLNILFEYLNSFGYQLEILSSFFSQQLSD